MIIKKQYNSHLSKNSKSKPKFSFSYYKKITNLIDIKKLQFIKIQLGKKLLTQYKKKINVLSIFKPKIKTKPLLPWIAQGRKQYNKSKRTLLSLLKQLKSRENGIAVLGKKQKKLIKRFKKQSKFSKFGRYGTHSSSGGDSKIEFKQPKPEVVNIITPYRRQNLYLQHKRLFSINNNMVLPYKYIYMLIIIWYLLTNVIVCWYKKLFKNEIWLTYFIHNIWAKQPQVEMNNLYLNYGITIGSQATIGNINLYNPSRNELNNQIKSLIYHQRLTAISSKYNTAANTRKSRKKVRIRKFFRISHKLKTSNFIENRFNIKKNIKNKNRKRLEPKEWLLVSKFINIKYQQQFPVVFSELKNIKKIQGYIDMQGPVWHQSYFISHPYYYTERHKTFIYQICDK